MNKQLADMSGGHQKFKVQRHDPPPQPDNYNPLADLPHNECTRSMNSDAFSQFSLPSNNFVNGLKVNVSQPTNPFGNRGENPMIRQSANESSQFSSAMRS